MCITEDIIMDKEKAGELIYGRNPIVEAIKKGNEFEKIYIQDSMRGETEKEIRSLCKEYNIPLSRVPTEKLNYLSRNQNHQGLIGSISPIIYQNLDLILAHVYEQGRNPLIVVLEGVSDVRNLGAIARSALLFGADALVFTAKNNASINADTIKSSAGAILQIPVCREKNMMTIIDLIQSYGVKILATDLQGASYIGEVNLTEPIAIIMGAEEKGVTLETLRRSDQRIKIPQQTDFDSLNVSVAAGVILYETLRQRKLH